MHQILGVHSLWRPSLRAVLTTAVTLLAMPSGAAVAQDAPSVIHGIVTDTRGRAIPFANVTLGTKRAVADDSGRFRMAVPARTRLDLQFRRLGFAPSYLTLPAAPDTAIVVALAPIPQQLQEQVITAEHPRGFDRWGFYQRMKEQERWGGTGYFITPEDIERRNFPHITRLFEGLPSVKVYPAGNPIGGVPMSSLHGGCVMATYLNGARLVVFADQDTKFATGDMYRNITRARSGRPGIGNPAVYPGLDFFISSTTVSAIEVYPRPTSAPPQYQHLNGSCGVILIWSK